MKRAFAPDKACKQCRKLYNRKMFPNGSLEAVTDFIKRKFCCHRCYTLHNTGSAHVNYKDGFRRGHDGGYLRLSDGRYVHRVVMEKHLKRKLKTYEHIHHIDGDVTNNSIENLEITTNSAHRKHHVKTQKRSYSNGRFSV